MTLAVAKPLSEEEVGRLFGVVFAQLKTLTLNEARLAVAAAGITDFDAPEQVWHPFLAGVQRAFYRLEPEARLTALIILASEFSHSERVQKLFAQHGYEYIDDVFVPTTFLDQREALYLPQSSASEIAKATKRLVDGDETGAITSACGAIDTLMQKLYDRHNLGDPARTAFAAKVNTAAQHLSVFENVKSELSALGVSDQDADSFTTDMKKATNHAAQMLQTLRRALGDVHGSKPASRRTAYEAIKWASAICGLFEEFERSSTSEIYS